MMPHTLSLPPKYDEKWALSEQASRSWVKAITWRLTATTATFIISWFIAQDLAVASGIATVQLFVNFVLYFVHERVWNRVQWGKQ